MQIIVQIQFGDAAFFLCLSRFSESYFQFEATARIAVTSEYHGASIHVPYLGIVSSLDITAASISVYVILIHSSVCSQRVCFMNGQ